MPHATNRINQPKPPPSSWWELIARSVLNVAVLALSLITFTIFVIGSYDYIKNVEENKCEMTYMYEFPQFVRIKLGDENDKQFPMYRLYTYAEGNHITAARENKFTGIPVLFIPGNAGSFKQVRSLASLALRKWLDSGTPFHFDFFALDFNDEISGLYGYVLERQADYARIAIDRITTLYEDYHQVVVIGHSVGGIIAKSINTEQPVVQLIYTLATPHYHPVVITDPEIDLFYYYVNKNWTKTQEIIKDDKHGLDVALVSIAGGDRDLLVPSKLTRWEHNDIHVGATGVPGCWASTDHLSAVWCKQLMLTVIRSLFDLVELNKKNQYYSITSSPTLKRSVLNYHFVKRSAGKSYHNAHYSELELGKPPTFLWNEVLTGEYCHPASRNIIYVMFPLVRLKERVLDDFEKHRILVTTTNTKAKNWVFGCTNQDIANYTRYCSAGENLAQYGVLHPHFRRTAKILHMNFADVEKYSHIVVKMDPAQFKTCVNIEVYHDDERSRDLSSKFQTHGSIFYNLTLPGLELSRLFAWRVTAQSIDGKCKDPLNSVGIFQHGPYQEHKFFRNESLIVRFSDWTAETSSILLYLNTHCRFSVSVKLAPIETAGQLFRTFTRLLPSFYASVILMSLYFQESPTEWKNFHRILLANSYFLTILPGLLVSMLLVIVPNDWPSIMDAPEYNTILPILLYLVAYVLVLVVSSGAWYIIIGFGHGIHAICMKLVADRFGNGDNVIQDKVVDLAFARFPVTISVFLVSLCFGTCGALSISTGVILFIVKLFKMYEEMIHELWKMGVRHFITEGLSSLNFQFTCAMLWCVVAAINLPSLMYWINNFSYGPIPQWDLSLYLCLMLTPTVAVSWQSFVPQFHPYIWHLHRYVCYVMGIAVVVWGTHRIYVIALVVTVVLITLSICQLISSIYAMGSMEVEEQSEGVVEMAQEASEVNDSGNLSQEEEESQSCDEIASSQTGTEDESDEMPPLVEQEENDTEKESTPRKKRGDADFSSRLKKRRD